MRLKQTSQELSAAISPLRETVRRTSRTQAISDFSHFSTFCQKRHRHFIIDTRTHSLPPSQRKQAPRRYPRQWVTEPQDSFREGFMGMGEGRGASRNMGSNVRMEALEVH
ncbi:hypothetical protein CDAR_60161 [Caerostris darwini]|uniref:Uncharacterized protein n=1 Tax=Caerostris darwini TaxID=1538125 RepID=A0AAV4QLE9_9ARAC|nr:hypothetical protein CDAR_60161 [Caerostris darwini]